jgi:hypothetical protein
MGSTVGSVTSQSWKRKPRFWLAPELSKIEISEGLVVEDARPAALAAPALPTITLRLLMPSGPSGQGRAWPQPGAEGAVRGMPERRQCNADLGQKSRTS